MFVESILFSKDQSFQMAKKLKYNQYEVPIPPVLLDTVIDIIVFVCSIYFKCVLWNRQGLPRGGDGAAIVFLILNTPLLLFPLHAHQAVRCVYVTY